MKRFDRQLRYFSDITTGPTASECQEMLANSRIAVLGVGGLGGWSALNLACVGIGEMLLVDFDRVELSNLNRQVLFSEADIGRYKAVAAGERLRGFNSAMRVETRLQKLDSEAAIAETIAGYDMVIDACRLARPRHRALDQLGLLRRRHPLHRDEPLPAGRPGRAALRAGSDGCFACQEIGYRRAYPLFDVAMEQQRGET